MVEETLLLRGSVSGVHAFKTAVMFVASTLFTAGGVALLWVDWRWGLGVSLVFTFGILLAGLPLLRMGRYELTTQRLIWRPFFGKRREILVAEIPPGDVDVDADSASIKLTSHALKMGAVWSYHDLWGGLMLAADLARLPAPATETAIDARTVSWRARRHASSILGVWGSVVLRPEYAAFIPDEFAERRSTGAQAAKLALGLGLALVGVGVSTSRAKPPIHPMVEHARKTSSERFDAVVMRLVDLTGGVVLAPRDVRIQVKPLGPHASEITFGLPGGATCVGQVEAALAGYVAHLTAPGIGHRTGSV